MRRDKMILIASWALVITTLVGVAQAESACSPELLSALKENKTSQEVIDLMCHGKFTPNLQPGELAVKTGIIDAPTSRNQAAPLTIVAPGSAHVYVKLVDAQSNAVALTGLIRLSEKLEMKVPLGTYRLRYATGLNWYGTEKLFGYSTSYAEADNTLQFEISNDGRVSGYEIELLPQRKGNLRNKSLKPSEF